MSFGNQLREIRLKKRLTQAAAAKIIGVPIGTYLGYEYDRYKKGPKPFVQAAILGSLRKAKSAPRRVPRRPAASR